MREKRRGDELEERSEIDRKRVKMRDLDSVLRSEGKYFENFSFFCSCWVIGCCNLG